ncbi:MAG: radical SAM protein [Nanoarchaeota archaeon]|nr:radical SAM protein [Nanoarchaeota archaeon]
MPRIKKTPFHSYSIGALPKGCQMCTAGKKSVFFITGLCSKDCFFCPISDEKKNNDIIYINEWPTGSKDDIIKEIELCSSNGIGITGGDPLLKLDRTIRFIRLLKRRFGMAFHIHIYLPLELITENKLKKFSDAGLDEIRFHPDLDDETHWKNLELATKFKWNIGVEIPVIPKKEKETKRLIDFIADKIQFLNLNELEFSDTNYNRILEQGYTAIDDISYAVHGSAELGKVLMDYILEMKYAINVHFCTAKLKDRIQLTTRIKNRAQNIAEEYDKVTKDGTIIRGAIYLKELYPGFDYRKKLKELSVLKKKAIIKRLENAKKEIQEKYDIPDNLIGIDDNKLRILTHANIVMELKSKVTDYKVAVVEEYPTYDMFEVEVDILN